VVRRDKEQQETRYLTDCREDLSNYFKMNGSFSTRREEFLKQHAVNALEVVEAKRLGTYTGNFIALLETPDKYVLYSDYFGSCAVCDKFIEASSEGGYGCAEQKSEEYIWGTFLRTLESSKQFESLDDIENYVMNTSNVFWRDRKDIVKEMIGDSSGS